MGRIVQVDLTRGTCVDLPPEPYAAWLGGRGLGSAVVAAQVPRAADALAPENVIVLAAGPLAGTPVPGASRISVVTKHAQSGGISYSTAGGHFAPELRLAGVDALVISGQAAAPCYIAVADGRVEVRDAAHLWGCTTWAAEERLQAEWGDRAQVLAIGPAGERLSRVACLITAGAHAAGWGGSGAVFGSKRLKAVVARGSGELAPAHPARFMAAVERLTWKVKSSEAIATLRRVGTHGGAGVGGWSGRVPTSVRNLQSEHWAGEKAARIRESAYRGAEIGRTTCYGCPTACMHFYEWPEPGPYQGLRAEGMHANSVRGFGSNWDMDDPGAVLQVHALCNSLGLDTDGVSAAVAWAMECWERGILTAADTGGIDLSWGNAGSAIAVVRQIGAREGFGALLADGVAAAARQLGRGSEAYAMQVKGVGINEQGMRSHRAWALGILTSTRGGGHLSGSPQVENRQISREVGELLFGLPEAGVPGSYTGKGRLVAWVESLKAVTDALGVCYFNGGWYEVALMDLGEWAELYEAMTGLPSSREALTRAGRRIVNLEKAFNTLHAGFTRHDDQGPDRIYDLPNPDGPYAGERLDRGQLGRMLDEYYAAHGWDPRTSWPTRPTLEGLDLAELADALAAAGRLGGGGEVAE